MASLVTRLGGLATVLGGALVVAHGLVTLLTDRNLDPLPPTTLMWAFGLIGLYGLLRRQRGVLGLVGGSVAYLSLTVALVQFVALLLLDGEEAPFWQIHVVGLVGSLLLVLVAVLLLGLTALRSAALPAGWRGVPVVVGLVWLPLFGFGEWLGDQISPGREIALGFVLTGLPWIVLGVVLLTIRRE